MTPSDKQLGRECVKWLQKCRVSLKKNTKNKTWRSGHIRILTALFSCLRCHKILRLPTKWSSSCGIILAKPKTMFYVCRLGSVITYIVLLCTYLADCVKISIPLSTNRHNTEAVSCFISQYTLFHSNRGIIYYTDIEVSFHYIGKTQCSEILVQKICCFSEKT